MERTVERRLLRLAVSHDLHSCLICFTFHKRIDGGLSACPLGFVSMCDATASIWMSLFRLAGRSILNKVLLLASGRFVANKFTYNKRDRFQCRG